MSHAQNGKVAVVLLGDGIAAEIPAREGLSVYICRDDSKGRREDSRSGHAAVGPANEAVERVKRATLIDYADIVDLIVENDKVICW